VEWKTMEKIGEKMKMRKESKRGSEKKRLSLLFVEKYSRELFGES
jgi:hypothetical protein